jgi:hypothetical protein
MHPGPTQQTGHHLVRWRSYGRRELELSLTALFPASDYARARGLPITARLPRAFRCEWKGEGHHTRSTGSGQGAAGHIPSPSSPPLLLPPSRSANSWLGPTPLRLLSAYTTHHAWRAPPGRQPVAWELREVPAPAPAGAAAEAPEATARAGAGAAGSGAGPRWAARLTVLPFGRDAPIVVESGAWGGGRHRGNKRASLLQGRPVGTFQAAGGPCTGLLFRRCHRPSRGCSTRPASSDARTAFARARRPLNMRRCAFTRA